MRTTDEFCVGAFCDKLARDMRLLPSLFAGWYASVGPPCYMARLAIENQESMSVSSALAMLRAVSGRGRFRVRATARTPSLPRRHLHALEALVDGGCLARLGWYESCATGRPVDGAGEPLPWFTYPSIRLLEERLPDKSSVLEFGAGMSTLWWGKRARRVLTIENDQAWSADISGRAPATVELLHVPLPKLGSTLDELAATGETFDIAVVDNFDRATVAAKLLPFLGATSVIVFDNSDELVYRPCVDHLLAQGYRELRLHALGPVNPFEWSTSFLYRDGNCLGL